MCPVGTAKFSLDVIGNTRMDKPPKLRYTCHAENPDEYPDYMEEYIQILSAVFEDNDGHVYLYPYDIADRYAGDDWMEVLMGIDGIENMSDKEIVAEFLKLGTDLEKACRDYLAEEVMTVSPGY